MGIAGASARPADLPQYQRPPIDEVAIGIHFQPILGYSDAMVGTFREEVASDFPRFENQPRIEQIIETLSSGLNQPPAVSFGTPISGARTWLISSDDSLLFQLQDNLFVLNWRRRNSDYPRYEQLIERFWQGFRRFRDTVGGRLDLRQAELTYVNWITEQDPTEYLVTAQGSNLDAVSNLDEVSVGAPEDQGWAARYLIRENENPIARLLVSSQPGVRVQGGTGYQLSLVFRSPIPPGDVKDDRLDTVFSIGREAIVRAFTALTTESAHEKWGIE